MWLREWLCIAAVVSVVVAAQHHRNEGGLTIIPNPYLSSDPPNTRQNTYSSHHTQEGRNNARGNWSNQGSRSRHSPGGIMPSYGHPFAATRHESQALQPRRVDSTGLPIVQDPQNQPLEIHSNREAHILSMGGRNTVDTQAPTNLRQRTPNTHSRQSDISEGNLVQRLVRPDHCCGSSVPFDPHYGRLTGGFQRVASAGSFKVVQVPDASSFPPSDVMDLQAVPLDPHTITLSWTATGDDLDSGIVESYVIRLSETRGDLQETQFDTAPEETLLETERLRAAGVYQEAGTSVSAKVPVGRPLLRGLVYYVALKAKDHDGYTSGVSNVAQFILPETFFDTTTAAPGPETPLSIHTPTPPRPEEPLNISSSRGISQRSREIVTDSEELSTPPPSQDMILASEPPATESLTSTQPPSMSSPGESPPSGNRQRKRRNRRKKNKSKNRNRRRKGRRRNGRRRKSENHRENSQKIEKGNKSVLSTALLDLNAEIDRWNLS